MNNLNGTRGMVSLVIEMGHEEDVQAFFRF